jgi:hypothetical protein
MAWERLSFVGGDRQWKHHMNRVGQKQMTQNYFNSFKLDETVFPQLI